MFKEQNLKKTEKMKELEERFLDPIEVVLKKSYDIWPTAKEASKNLKISSWTFRNWLELFGVEKKSQSRIRKLMWQNSVFRRRKMHVRVGKTAGEIEERFKKPLRVLLHELYHEKKHNPRRIAEIIEAPRSRVVYWLKHFNIPLRTLSEAIALRWQDNQYKEKHAMAGKTQWEDPVFRAVMTEKRQEEQYRIEKSRQLKEAWRNPEIREKIIQGMRTPVAKNNFADRQRRLWQDDTYKETLVRSIKEAWKDETLREKARQRSIQLWQNPQWRSTVTQAIRDSRIATVERGLLLLSKRNELIERNIKLVMKIANAYLWSGMEFKDLVQEGVFGLMSAAERFDPDRGYKFSSYAAPHIKGQISTAIANQDSPIRMPIRVRQGRAKIRETIASFTAKTGERPTIEEIAELTQLKPARVQQIIELVWRLPAISLNQKAGANKEDELESLIGNPVSLDPQNELDLKNLKEETKQVLSVLSPKQNRVLGLYFGLDDGIPRTLEEIGETFGVSKERISQIKNETLDKLKHSERLKVLWEEMG